MKIAKIVSAALFRTNPMTPLGLWGGCFGLLIICVSKFSKIWQCCPINIWLATRETSQHPTSEPNSGSKHVIQTYSSTGHMLKFNASMRDNFLLLGHESAIQFEPCWAGGHQMFFEGASKTWRLATQNKFWVVTLYPMFQFSIQTVVVATEIHQCIAPWHAHAASWTVQAKKESTRMPWFDDLWPSVRKREQAWASVSKREQCLCWTSKKHSETSKKHSETSKRTSETPKRTSEI